MKITITRAHTFWIGYVLGIVVAYLITVLGALK